MKVIFLLAMTLMLMSRFIYTSAGGLAYAQAGATTSGNVTAQIAPQGTSLNALNKTTPSANESSTTSGNVTAQIAPQGTSLNADS